MALPMFLLVEFKKGRSNWLKSPIYETLPKGREKDSESYHYLSILMLKCPLLLVVYHISFFLFLMFITLLRVPRERRHIIQRGFLIG